MSLLPKQTELSIQYSVSVKGSLPHNQYENAQATVSRSERWDVQGMTEEEIDSFWADRYEALHEELGKIIEAEYEEITNPPEE